MDIIKRDGSKVEFNKQKIKEAILKSMKYGSGMIEKDIADTIANGCEKDFQEITPTVHEVEDYVYDGLIEFEQFETAKAYEGYRAVQEYKRNTHPLDESIMNLIGAKDEFLLKENANKNAELASTQRDLMAGSVSRYLALHRVIPTNLVQAHNEGLIKIHDLDYFLQNITNCELIPLNDLFEKGTVINGKMIETPKSLATAMTLATQIITQVTSFTYGGASISISHLSPYVRASYEKYKRLIKEEGSEIGVHYSDEQIENIAKIRLKKEIKDGVQTFNYQLSTMNSTNGQSPFLSLFMYLDENKEYIEETAMLIEEFLNQRIEGLKNEFGMETTQTFPKLLFVLDEDNMCVGTKYYYLKKLAIKSTAKRMSPDYMSAKIMKEVYGAVFPNMGCRSFLYPFKDENGNFKWYGRMNLGVVTINLPDIALSSDGDEDKFWDILNNRMENLVKPALELRYTKLKGAKAKVAPLLWQHGVFARLQADDYITDALDKVGFSLSIGYTGIYETTKFMTGESHTTKNGFKFAESVMKFLEDKANQWKEETGLGFSTYGTPQEESTDWFTKKLKAKFGEVKDITDKGFITNSYHVDVRENIDAFSKLEIEGRLQRYSKGGNVSYVESSNMENNLEALEEVIDCIYENNIHAEINTESDTCADCGYSGCMDNDPNTLEWVCPQCSNRNQDRLSVIRRVCGYLSDKGQFMFGRMMDILNRVKHI